MYKISFFVPEKHLEIVKEAVFGAGAGRIGTYDCCSWQVKGEGQFRPLEGSSPFIGKKNEIERLSEYLVEMVCDDDYIREAVLALKESHPYEEPAYHVWRLDDF